jgi:hypothetical protein
MSGLGIDIKEVYTELASEFTIVNRSPVITGERILFEVNAQATKPFIREHQLDCTIPYDSAIETGDVVLMNKTNRYFMVMNKTPETFEDETVEWDVVLYFCNLPVTAHLVRPVEIRNKVTYNMTSGWQVTADAPLYGLLTDRITGSEIEQQNVAAGQLQLWSISLLLPKYYDVKPLDRLIISATEYYKIETIESYYYPGVYQIKLVEDTRKATVIIDGEVYDG